MKIKQRGVWQMVASQWRALGLATLATVVTTAALRGQTPAVNVYRVEEDWQLVVGQPDLNSNGPQVTCAISPADMQTAYCAFDINYHTQPDYSAGGLQLHTWDPSNLVEIANSSHTGMLQYAGETLTWTQTMAWSDNVLTFRVLNGQSQTWGTFGGPSGLLALNLPTSLSNLNQYAPNVSLDNSGVSFAGNLVTSLTLQAVRWYDVNGNLIQQVTTPQVVYP
ncbi:MAG TPA: hypothetical protein VMV69_26575 [Pirellulales bacterium]|nr:hypothetical protein [Pirellulales bacterium]